MTESKMQVILYNNLKYLHHRYITCNVYFRISIADMISVTEAGYVKEYEIKLSLADYRADFKKIDKHNRLKHRLRNIPSQFWYVIHGFELGADDVPEYAGLMRVEKEKYYSGYNIIIIKKAPRLSNTTITDAEKSKLFDAMYVRYWSLRIKRSRQLELI